MHKQIPVRGPNSLASAALKAHLTPVAMATVRQWLVEQLVADEHAKLGQGGHTHNQVPLQQVFVDLPVADSPNVEANQGNRVLFIERLLDSAPLRLGQVCKVGGPLSNVEGDGSRDEFELVEQKDLWDSAFAATLLVGGPGQGKSTLGQLACQLHRAALLLPYARELTTGQRDLLQSFVPSSSSKRKRREHSLRLPNPAFLPIHVSLPDFAAWLARDHRLADGELATVPTVLKFVTDLPSAKKIGISPVTLLALAVQMPSLIVFDGFDEVGATKDRSRLVEAAKELILWLGQRNAQAQVIATTRPQGYAGELAKIGLPLQERYLSPLSKDEAMEYAQKLVEAKIPGVDIRTKTLARLHEAAAEPATSRLLTTPLQVTILTALVQQLGRAPRERWNLFSRYFSYTYDREIERETYASRLLADHRSHIEQIHARVALLLQVEAERAGGASARMPRAQLESVINSVLLEDEVGEGDRVSLVQDIAKAAEQRLVFLVEPEPGSFGFEIRSLQEFMAAWALTSGRDSEIESRLQQVAKASMFRNVVLFMASRLYSEGSPLRDVLADKICAELDADSTEAGGSFTRAGGLLALETLEEGAVLSQPKRARALMERAISLFRLPPNSEHVRLARAVNSDTRHTLSDAIERAIRSEENEKFSYSAWICLLESINRGDDWARELGDDYWPKLSAPSDLLRKCETLGIPLGEWLINKVQLASDRVRPEQFINSRVLPVVEGGSTSWMTWLINVFDSRARWRRRQRTIFITSIERLDEPPVEPPDVFPPHWEAWVQAGRFEVSPTAATLAVALRTIARVVPYDRWSVISWRASWPLVACINSADHIDDLIAIAANLEEGKLGDASEWLEAQSHWSQQFDQLIALNVASENAPWDIASLSEAPPLFALPYWAFNSYRKQKNASSYATALLKRSAVLFRELTVASQKRAVAQVCLYLSSQVPQRTAKSSINVRDWIEFAPEDVSFLMPRPRWLSTSDWIKLLDEQRLADLELGFGQPAQLVDAVVESNGHPAVLRMLVMQLEMHNGQITLAPSAWHAIEAASRNNVNRTPIAEADLSTLRVYFGEVANLSDNEIVSHIEKGAIEQPEQWSYMLFALRESRLPSGRVCSLLRKIIVTLGFAHELSSVAVQQLRIALQEQKSGLEQKGIWDKLVLPLPYPECADDVAAESLVPPKPIVLKHIELKDVRGVSNLRIDLAVPPEGKGQWVILIGPNGVGKTTVLGSLALALRDAQNPAIWPRGAFGNTWSKRSPGAGAATTDAKIVIELADGVEHTTIIRAGEAITISQSPMKALPRLFPIFAYGCRRGSALGGSTRQVNLNDEDGPEIATLFDEGADLIHAETWLIQLEGDIRRNGRSQMVFAAVTNALAELLQVIKVEIDSQAVWVTEEGGARLPLGALSDGYLTFAGWFIDLIARWLRLAERDNMEVDDNFLSSMRGLVLIDEIDLHLHPQWQREIVSRTRLMMPQMSFVVTTHNPLTLVGATADEIWALSRDKSGNVTAINGTETPMLLTGGQIYKQYFEIDHIFPNGLGRDLQRYGFLASYAFRNDEEECEVRALQSKLKEHGMLPEWEVVDRISLSEDNEKKLGIKNKLQSEGAQP